VQNVGNYKKIENLQNAEYKALRGKGIN
jgi:hypothetical protein